MAHPMVVSVMEENKTRKENKECQSGGGKVSGLKETLDRSLVRLNILKCVYYPFLFHLV